MKDIFRVINEQNENICKGAMQLRLFSVSGVEYFEDDLKYIKDGTELYASKGLLDI